MSERALTEISTSEPYFKLLSNKSLSKRLRKSILKEAPLEFYSVLTQATRHLLNGSFCTKNRQYCKKFETSLYLLALPSTTKEDKQKIIESEPCEFVAELFEALIKNVHP